MGATPRVFLSLHALGASNGACDSDPLIPKYIRLLQEGDDAGCRDGALRQAFRLIQKAIQTIEIARAQTLPSSTRELAALSSAASMAITCGRSFALGWCVLGSSPLGLAGLREPSGAPCSPGLLATSFPSDRPLAAETDCSIRCQLVRCCSLIESIEASVDERDSIEDGTNCTGRPSCHCESATIHSRWSLGNNSATI